MGHDANPFYTAKKLIIIRCIYTLVTRGLKDIYITQISKMTDTTYSHCVKSINDWQQLGVLSLTKVGRVQKITLLKKGERLARLLVELENELGSLR